MIVALLLPAVQAVRESARRTECINNLHNIAIAAHSYHDIHRTFPPGWVEPENLDDYNNRYYDCHWCDIPITDFETPAKDVFLSFATTKIPEWYYISDVEGEDGMKQEEDFVYVEDWRMARYWGWHAMLLPQMGQMTTDIHFNEERYSENNWEAMQMKIPSYTCPSAVLANSVADGQLARRTLNGVQEISSDLGLTSYRGVRGYWADQCATDDAELDEEDPTDYLLHPGMFEINKQTRFSDVTDGESNTFMFGESTLGFWNDGFSCCASIHDDRPEFFSYFFYEIPDPGDVRPPDEESDDGVARDETRGNRFYRSQYFGFGSWHHGVSNFALVDGSVRSVSYTINGRVLRALMTRSRGEKVEMVD
ncbi:MAG: DUF1559 domain-containing protein [Planctomycetaceae bacterium]